MNPKIVMKSSGVAAVAIAVAANVWQLQDYGPKDLIISNYVVFISAVLSAAIGVPVLGAGIRRHIEARARKSADRLTVAKNMARKYRDAIGATQVNPKNFRIQEG